MHLNLAVHGLLGLVLLFEIYTIYQQFQIHKLRQEFGRGEELFRLISENAADMIAVGSVDGHRLYNSPSCQRVLGYSSEELKSASSLEQIHPDDRQRVREAAQEARVSGVARSIAISVSECSPV